MSCGGTVPQCSSVALIAATSIVMVSMGNIRSNNPAYHTAKKGNFTKYAFPSMVNTRLTRAGDSNVLAGADPSRYFARFDPVEEVDVSGKRKWYEAEEEVEMDENHRDQLQQLFHALGVESTEEIEPVNRLKAAVSDMLMGRIEKLRAYLETSSEKDIFLHGVQGFQARSYDIDEWDAYKDLLRSDEAEDVEPPEEKIVNISKSGETALHMAACEMYQR
jgi:hypothetical protein